MPANCNFAFAGISSGPLPPRVAVTGMQQFLLTWMFLAAAGVAAAQPVEQPAIPRLSPSAFRAVPRVVRQKLQAEHCRIPQPWPYRGVQNIVAGHFRSRSRTDYAALCSRNGVSSVLVLNGRTGAVLGELNRRPDAEYVQGVGDDVMGFSRVLERVSPSPDGFCLERGVPCPCTPAIYDGIADVFEGKASDTHCWRNGWHTVLSGY